MIEYIIELTMFALIVIGITALMGVMLGGIGKHLFGGKNKSQFVDQCARFQTGWKQVGGNK